MMTKIIGLAFLLSLVVFSPAPAQTRHEYMNGVVQAVTESSVTMAGDVFVLQPNVKILVQRFSNGAFHEMPGRMGDVHAGQSATLKVTGKVISEIIVEKWKQ